jgi:type I restriction enzyme R subunit
VSFRGVRDEESHTSRVIAAGEISPSGRNDTCADPYAFKCTASVGGSDFIADFRGAQRHHFIATTVDLLSTGVDVPNVRNVVFFRYLKSPIMLHQMVGRGTRIDAPSGKLAFRVYDYTNAMRLFGEPFITQPPRSGKGEDGPPKPPEKIIEVEGIEVRITDAGTSIAMQEDGKLVLVPLEEYRERIAKRLVEEAPTLNDFRARWVDPSARRDLLGILPDGGKALHIVQQISGLEDYDNYDILAELAYGLAAKTRTERAEAFTYKHEKWLASLPEKSATAIRALAMQFRRSGTEELENRHVFSTPEVVSAGGLDALKPAGDPAALLREVKGRMFEG